MKWTGHKTAHVFSRYNITSSEDLEQAADMLAVYRDARAETISERTAVVVH